MVHLAHKSQYAHLGFQDIFYLVRMELQLPASSIALPRPSEPVLQRLLDAGYPLPDTFPEPGSRPGSTSISPVVTRAASVKTRSGASSWISEEEFTAGVPITREMFGLAAQHAKKAKKEAEIVAAAAMAGQVAISNPTTPPAPVGSLPSSPAIPPLPKRSPSNPIVFGQDVKLPFPTPSPTDVKVPLPSCGCLDHQSDDLHRHAYAHSTKLSSDYAHSAKLSGDYKLSGDFKEPPRGDSPTIPLSPTYPVVSLNEEPSSYGNTLRPSTASTVDPSRRHTADIRALFEALPPEAQALAVKRLEEKKRQTERERAAAAAERRLAERRAAEEQARAAAEAEEQRERERQASWERAKAKAKAKEREHRARREHRRMELDSLETQQRELEKQRAQLIATQQLRASTDPASLQSMVDALPTPPARVDEDARRMIEARIAALQSALVAMGVEPGSPALAPQTRSPTISTSTPSRKFSTSSASHYSTSPLPSPVVTTPRSPFTAANATSHPFGAAGSSHRSVSSHTPSPAVTARHAPKPTAFNLDDHIDALCRASQESSEASHHENPISVLPLTPAAIVNATRPQRRESRRSPPPSYTLVDRSAS